MTEHKTERKNWVVQSQDEMILRASTDVLRQYMQTRQRSESVIAWAKVNGIYIQVDGMVVADRRGIFLYRPKKKMAGLLVVGAEEELVKLSDEPLNIKIPKLQPNVSLLAVLAGRLKFAFTSGIRPDVSFIRAVS